MNAKTTASNEEIINPRTTDYIGLMKLTGCGKKIATEIGLAANARIQIGRRVLWNVAKVEKYLDSISE